MPAAGQTTRSSPTATSTPTPRWQTSPPPGHSSIPASTRGVLNAARGAATTTEIAPTAAAGPLAVGDVAVAAGAAGARHPRQTVGVVRRAEHRRVRDDAARSAVGPRLTYTARRSGRRLGVAVGIPTGPGATGGVPARGAARAAGGVVLTAPAAPTAGNDQAGIARTRCQAAVRRGQGPDVGRTATASATAAETAAVTTHAASVSSRHSAWAPAGRRVRANAVSAGPAHLHVERDDPSKRHARCGHDRSEPARAPFALELSYRPPLPPGAPTATTWTLVNPAGA